MHNLYANFQFCHDFITPFGELNLLLVILLYMYILKGRTGK